MESNGRPEEREERDDAGDRTAFADPVAVSRSLEVRAHQVLDSAHVDPRTARDLRSALEQLVADRTNGEDPSAGITHLSELLVRVDVGR